jgi:predicted transcriptional regulator
MELLSEAESRAAEWIWANPGIRSMKLVEVCEANYGWKQSTVFTLLKRMEKKGLLVNEKSQLRMTVSRTAYFHAYTKEILKKYYGGSLAAFVESALQNDRISRQEAGRLIHVIREHTS